MYISDLNLVYVSIDLYLLRHVPKDRATDAIGLGHVMCS